MISGPTRVVSDRPAKLLLGLAWLTVLLGAGVPLLKVVLPVLALLVLLHAGASRLATRRLPVVLVALLVWILASGFWSEDRGGSVRAFANVIAAVAAGLVCGLLLRPEQARGALATVTKLVVAGNVLALLIAPEWATRPPAADPVAGWHGLFGHKNSLGSFLTLAVALLLFEHGRRRFWWLAAIAVLLVGSQSASAMGVSLILVAAALWWYVVRLLTRQWVRAAVRLVSGFLLVAGVALIVTTPSVVTDVFGRSSTLTGRTEIWTAVQRQIAAHPVLGVGWGGVWREGSSLTHQIWREARFEAFYAHNGYLDVVLQIGFVGGVLFLLMLVGTGTGLLARGASAGWGLLVLLALCLQAITESGPFTGGQGLLLLVLLRTMVAQDPEEPQLAPQPAEPAGQRRTPAVPRASEMSTDHGLRPSRPLASALQLGRHDGDQL